ncbi:FecR family protein [Chitinophaga cymbidii]|nr:FecR family protein [Chitinophaga cymbidii]
MLQPDEALYSLLCKYLLDEADAVERRWVEAWRKENTANEEVLAAIRRMLDVPAQATVYPGLDTESSWERLKRTITGGAGSEETQVNATAAGPLQGTTRGANTKAAGAGPGTGGTTGADGQVNAAAQAAASMRPLLHRYRWLQIAAVLAVLVGLGIWFSMQSREPVTFSGAQHAALEDGSQVIMEPGAAMQLAEGFGKKERRVVFSGKAVFDIKQDAQAPFVVMLGKTEIKVLGTRFMVDFRPEEQVLTVHVTSGRIRVSDPEKGESVVLSQGMLLKRNEPAQPFEVAAHVQDIAQKSLIFHDAPLEEVLQTLRAVYGITVSVEDSTLLQKGVTTNFENESIDNIMETIAFMTNTQVEKAGQQHFSIR